MEEETEYHCSHFEVQGNISGTSLFHVVYHDMDLLPAAWNLI